MISLVTDENRDGFLQACLFDEILGARMRTLLECYGLDMTISQLWLQTDGCLAPTAAVSRFAGRLSVSASTDADTDELAEFAATIGGFSYAEASARLCKSLKLSGEYHEAQAMRYNAGMFTADFGGMLEDPPIREIFEVIRASDPRFAETSDFAGWYTHASHLFRHGLGFAGMLLDNGKPVSVGGVYTMGEHVAVIGCLATLPDHRGKGHAALITKYLVNRILELGKTPALLCEDKFAGYYARLGFAPAGRSGSLAL